jgi:RNA polymerase sigma-70 factor (ECF subfamily)
LDWTRLHGAALRESRRVLGAAADAEDAAQEATLRAWRAAPATALERPEAWVRHIARNEALRIAGRRPTTCEALTGQEPDARPDWRARVSGADEHVDLRRRLIGLSAAQRRLLYQRYWLDLSYREIADRSGIPEGTVKVRLHRLHGMLRRTFEEEAP